jgi:hypothetical protein
MKLSLDGYSVAQPLKSSSAFASLLCASQYQAPTPDDKIEGRDMF